MGCLMVLFDDPYFFAEFRLEHFPDFAFGEFRELDNVLPYRSFGTHEKIRVVRGNLHAADTGTLETRLIDELAGARARGIRKIRAAGKPGRLLGTARRQHFRHAEPGERVFRLRVGQVEFRGQHDMSILSFQHGSPVRVSQFRVRKKTRFAGDGIENFDTFDNLVGFESEASGIPDDGASDSPGESDPGNQRGDAVDFDAFGNERPHKRA